MKRVREQREYLRGRLPVLQAVFAGLLLVIASSYWFVQVVRGDHYRELADNNRIRRLPIRAPRGLVYDRHGRALAENVPSYDLYLDLSRSEDTAAALSFAGEVLGRPPGELESDLNANGGGSRTRRTLVAQDLALSEVARFSVSTLEYPEFEIEVGQLRLYRHGPTTAHVLGYLGEATEADLERAEADLEPGDLVGRQGIERAYDGLLRGVDGERTVTVDSLGRIREQVGHRGAQAGRELHLALDLDLQQEAAHYLEGRVGAAVALDPRNGEILVLASSPSYDPNVFARRLDRARWRALVDAPHDPLQNRALQNAFSPGSLFKIVMAVAGLSEGVIDTRSTSYCGGATRIYNRRFRCWKRSGHGRVNLRDALKESCDVFFYELGGTLGIQRIADYARRFGLGRRTGLDIGGELAGLVPDPEWSLRRRGTPWYPGETISVSIGQGPILATPLQIASLFSVVANRGSAPSPRVARLPRDNPRETMPLDPGALQFLREALWAVVNEGGTGAAARVAGFDIAGKTGTAQVIRQATWTENEELAFEQRDHAWFAAYGPAADPELVAVAFVEHGGLGSRSAAPLVKLLYETYLRDPGAG